MKKRYLYLSLAAIMLASSISAQEWNHETYPDYNPGFSNPDPALVHFGKQDTRQKVRRKAEELKLPEFVNNASSLYFPPVFNQDGGSCGSASRIAYMFTHEINAYRNLDASKVENQYPTHFVWLLTYGNSGKDEFVTSVGVPNVPTYGGRTYSRLFGNQDWTDYDFGWMTGYDKWYQGFFNRMKKPTTIPFSLGTEEGRLAAKAWLYNHAGDNSFHCGGLIGLGVASGGTWERIPSTPNNDRIGVSNMFYVKKWGTQVDHALTMVGYDDRIEFDLDGNGVFGEIEKDEKGAWIIVNSWGQWWCNQGFIYCPYAYAGSNFNNDGTFSKNWWYGELYHTRKDYRPFRTIKLKMDYSRRSEMLLQAGISQNIDATEPESVIDMHHFRYAGDGRNGDSVPAPEVPMLGRWADQTLHKEPMEFGYDLTDLSADYDRNKPLKYFFIINTKETAIGTGNIYAASIIDYEHDLKGVETPFVLGENGKVEIQNKGKRTIISVVVQGAGYNAPTGLRYASSTLYWNAPMPSGHAVSGYKIYKEGKYIGSTPSDTHSFAATQAGCYSVSTQYKDGSESAQVSINTTVEKPTDNVVINLKGNGFTIPDIFNQKLVDCTIEYYIRPHNLSNYNNAYGPGWGTFLAHCTATGSFSIGWNTNKRINTAPNTLRKNVWTHLALVVSGNEMSLYSNQNKIGSVTSANDFGIGGFGNLVFHANASSNQNANYINECSYDEIRIWNRARSSEEIKNTYNREFYGDVMPEGLIAYYKGDTFEQDGNTYLRDCVGGHHALITNNKFASEVPSAKVTLFRPKNNTNTLKIDLPTENVVAGVPVTLKAKRNDGIRTLLWDVPALEISGMPSTSPSFLFPKAGNYKVIVRGTDYEADGPSKVAREISDTVNINVSESAIPVADFTLTQTSIASGERISMHATNPNPTYIYTWSLPGAEQEQTTSASTAATYQAAGTYTITLTVTSPSGQKSTKSQQIDVRKVAPVANFTVSDPVIELGKTTILSNTSKHSPTNFSWNLRSKNQEITVNGGQNYHFTPTAPGVYDLKLTATNELGTDEKTQERAIIVTNADSKNGLNFSYNAARVRLEKPIIDEKSTQFLTISWWMNPTKLSSYCLGMGEATNSLLLRTDAAGNMYFYASEGEAKSPTNKGKYVIPGQWHHYAVVFTRGTVRFFRDAELIGSTKLVKNGRDITSINCPKTFTLGTEDAPMSGSIDEFTIWNSTLNANIFQTFCNAPIPDPELYVTGEKQSYKLRLYYQFNQSGGSVQDATSNKNNGVRTDFGPDGDAWGLSKGVFCLNFDAIQPGIVINGINNVKQQDRKVIGTYTLDGRRVSEKALQPGIYIQNNKKIIVK